MINVYETKSMKERLCGNPYAGRGIVTGMSADGTKGVAAYFIMGRSANSRNRVFREEGDDLVIYPFDESKVEDPSLIIYYPLRKLDDLLLVTNGDQTDTAARFIIEGGTFEDALMTREFEPDGPNWTPRISAQLRFDNPGKFSYRQSILKSADDKGSACSRYFFNYEGIPGLGHFIHTYMTDGDPLPTFLGEPERVSIPDDIDAFTSEIWDSLDQDNRISLYVRYVDIESGKTESRLINKNK